MEALEGELTALYLNDESFETNISLELRKKKVDMFNTHIGKIYKLLKVFWTCLFFSKNININ